MKKSFNVSRVIIFLSLLTILTGYEKIWLTLISLEVFFIPSASASAYGNYYLSAFSEYYVSLGLFLILNLGLFFFRKKIPFFNNPAKPVFIYLLFLLYLLLFAPLISGIDPNFSKDQKITALLPPFSKVKVVYLKGDGSSANEGFKSYKKLKPALFRENLIFADKTEKEGANLALYSEGNKFTLPQKDIASVEGHIFICGTDELGRDVYSRLVYSARYSLFVGFGAVIISVVIGLSLGFISGYYGKPVDSILNRTSEILLAFPVIFLIIFILSLFGNNIFIIIIILGLTGWMSLFKIVRNETVSAMNQDYFLSAEMLGLKKSRLVVRELLPVIFFPLVVNVIFQYGAFILAESALGFLGVGTGQDIPSWGRMIHSGQVYLSRAWWLIFFPSVMLVLTLLAFNSLANFFSFNFSRTSK